MENTSQIVVEPKTFEKLKTWEDTGSKVFHAQCINLGCLRTFFTKQTSGILCPHCRCMVPENQFRAISVKDLKSEEFVPEKITKDDLEISIDWKGTIILNIRQYWRPIKIGYLPTGDFWEDTYHQMGYGNVVDESEAEDITKQIENGKFIDEHLEMITAICKEFGYELEEKK